MSEKAKGLRTEAYPHSEDRDKTCVLCGGEDHQVMAAIRLMDGERNLGDVCKWCAAAGPLGAAERLRARIAELQKLAGRMGTIVHWATTGDLRQARVNAREGSSRVPDNKR